MEKRVVAAMLAAIREREASKAGVPDTAASSVPPARLREAFFSDFRGVAELKRRWGLLEDSMETWEHLWRKNPALAHMRSEPPMGWVLEADGKIVGYLGNVSLLCRYGDKTLIAVVGHGLAVDLPYRALSLTLIAAFFHQKHVDLYLSTTAVEAVGKMARTFKSTVLPQADYDTVLFWVLRPYPFAKAVLSMLGLKRTIAGLGSLFASVAIAADTGLRRRWPRKTSTGLVISEVPVSDIGDNFHNLWLEKLKEKPRLLAERSPATLRWHFDIPGDPGTTRVLCCSRDGKLVGYLVIRHDALDERSGLRRSIIVDILVKEDNPEAIEALLVAAYRHAMEAGSHILEVLGFPQSVRRICAQWRPYLRTLRESRYHYKAADPILHHTLSDGAAWYATPFDGDTTLTTRLPASAGQLGTGNEVASSAAEEHPIMVP
jgi:hypothetical protein